MVSKKIWNKFHSCTWQYLRILFFEKNSATITNDESVTVVAIRFTCTTFVDNRHFSEKSHSIFTTSGDGMTSSDRFKKIFIIWARGWVSKKVAEVLKTEQSTLGLITQHLFYYFQWSQGFKVCRLGFYQIYKQGSL